MNGQTRSAPPNYSNINPLTKVQLIQDYRGYKKIFFLRAFGNAYIGYFIKDSDPEFFGFTVPEEKKHLWIMEAKEAIDYYLDQLFFHNPVLEYDIFKAKPEYGIFLTALKMKMDQNEKP